MFLTVKANYESYMGKSVCISYVNCNKAVSLYIILVLIQ